MLLFFIEPGFRHRGPGTGHIWRARASDFRGPLNWYRNIARIPTLAPFLEGARIQVPAYFLAGSEDPALQFVQGACDLQDARFADLRGKRLIEGAAHWLQEEKPEQVSGVIVEFLKSIRDH